MKLILQLVCVLNHPPPSVPAKIDVGLPWPVPDKYKHIEDNFGVHKTAVVNSEPQLNQTLHSSGHVLNAHSQPGFQVTASRETSVLVMRQGGKGPMGSVRNFDAATADLYFLNKSDKSGATDKPGLMNVTPGNKPGQFLGSTGVVKQPQQLSHFVDHGAVKRSLFKGQQVQLSSQAPPSQQVRPSTSQQPPPQLSLGRGFKREFGYIVRGEEEDPKPKRSSRWDKK